MRLLQEITSINDLEVVPYSAIIYILQYTCLSSPCSPVFTFLEEAWPRKEPMECVNYTFPTVCPESITKCFILLPSRGVFHRVVNEVFVYGWERLHRDSVWMSVSPLKPLSTHISYLYMEWHIPQDTYFSKFLSEIFKTFLH